MSKQPKAATSVAEEIKEIAEFFELHMPVATFQKKLSAVAINHLRLYILYREYHDHAHRIAEIEDLDDCPMYADEVLKDVNLITNFLNLEA